MRSDAEDGIYRTYEEEQRGTLCYSIGVETIRKEETRSTKNNMEENG